VSYSYNFPHILYYRKCHIISGPKSLSKHSFFSQIASGTFAYYYVSKGWLKQVHLAWLGLEEEKCSVKWDPDCGPKEAGGLGVLALATLFKVYRFHKHKKTTFSRNNHIISFVSNAIYFTGT